MFAMSEGAQKTINYYLGNEIRIGVAGKNGEGRNGAVTREG